jgi:uncharacterized protein with PIN domain
VKICIRAYAELNDFLSHPRRQRQFVLELRDSHSVRHVLESVGIPHTEIEVILINGRSVDFSHRVKEGDRIAVYPVFESIDVSPLLRLRPRPLRETRFLLDVNLGGLTPLLRLLGFDSSFPGHMEDGAMVEKAVMERRILLTRDRDMLKRRAVTHGFWIRSQIPLEQTREVLDRLDLYGSIRPFTRCVRCSGLLQSVEKENVLDRLEPLTARYYNEFRICGSCAQIYWKGSHFDALTDLIEKLSE